MLPTFRHTVPQSFAFLPRVSSPSLRTGMPALVFCPMLAKDCGRVRCCCFTRQIIQTKLVNENSCRVIHKNMKNINLFTYNLFGSMFGASASSGSRSTAMFARYKHTPKGVKNFYYVHKFFGLGGASKNVMKHYWT